MPDKNQETISEEKESFETKDKWTILALRSKGHVPVRIEQDKSASGSPILVYVFPGTAYEDFDSYSRGEPFPVDDIRKIQQMDTEFKNNLYRHSDPK
jgi:hypothetical protein